VNLSTTEIAQLRADQADYYPDSCTIQTVSRSRDTQGGWTETWANTYTSVKCRMAPMLSQQKEEVQGEQLQALTRLVLTVAYNQTIDETMRVVHDSQTFEVDHMEDTHSNRTAKRIYLRRLD